MLRRISLLLALALSPLATSAQDAPVPARVVVLPDTTGPQISRHIYGQFIEHLGRNVYGGFWVGEDSDIPNDRGYRTDVVEALRTVGVPNARWPGGCFADIYHWRDGIGPKEDRPAVPNRFWGHVMEDNSFGTHEFMELADLLGAETYIAGNLGSGTVEEMADWAEYLTSEQGPAAELRKQNGREEPWDVAFFGVGNENWGCGGNMRAEFYADEFNRYTTYVNQYGRDIYPVASGPSAGYGGHGDDLEWTDALMRISGRLMHGYSLHYYTVTNNWTVKGSATQFGEDEWFRTLKKAAWIDSVITAHARVMDKYDPRKRVAIVFDEWGTWYDVEEGHPGYTLYQQNTLRDALVAGISLNAFNNHADRVRIANLAQTVNVLQAMILTEGDQMVKTPTYHVFDLFRPHWDATLIPTLIEGPQYTFGDESQPAVTVSMSRDGEGAVFATATNIDPHRSIALRIPVPSGAATVTTHVVTAEAMQAYNDFGKPERVTKAGYSDMRRDGDDVIVTLPPKSVVSLHAR